MRNKAVLDLTWRILVLAAIVGLSLAGGPQWLIASLLVLLGVQPTQPSDPKSRSN